MPNRSCAPPERHAEAGHHLVEDEQRAVRVVVISRSCAWKSVAAG
jgi:hypothetical protein